MKPIIGLFAVFLLLAGAGAGCLPPATPTPVLPSPQTSNATPPATPLDFTPSPPPSNQAMGLPSIADIVERVKPAVVSIQVEGVQFNIFLQPVPLEGAGSGFIFDSQGYILTNNHVIEGATSIQVSLPDGRTFAARTIGRDPNQDLAVLKIEGQDLPALPLGDSSSLRVGDWVIALGNALGLEGGPTVTVGVVGALDRSIQEPGGAVLSSLVQTDAAINPGNSGGPLVNLRGEVVGINTAIELEERIRPIGIGFAIASNTAQEAAQRLMSQAQPPQPFLGVDMLTVTPAIAARFGLATQQGVLISLVLPGTGASQAGLRAGDVILRFARQDVTNREQVVGLIQAHQVGDLVEIVVLRGTRQLTVSVTLGQAP
ncbi:MAG: trypsin-like peptidase domain-containing protein [Chloroflexi bacterium]|nr:trypsin-like peptidase domain-containing protein [Chloroflexota bacterium]